MRAILIAIALLSMPASAYESTKMRICADKAQFSYSAAKARDLKQEKDSVKDRVGTVAKSVELNKVEVDEMMFVIDMAYASALSPDEFSDKFFKACLSAANF